MSRRSVIFKDWIAIFRFKIKVTVKGQQLEKKKKMIVPIFSKLLNFCNFTWFAGTSS